MLRGAFLLILLAAVTACGQARLEVTRDDASSTLLLRAGPVKMNAGAAANVGPLEFAAPLSGWAVWFQLRVTDEKKAELSGRLLKQVSLDSGAQPDLLCPKKQAHLFLAFTAPAVLPEFPGIGFAIESGDKIRLQAALANDGAQEYDSVYVEIKMGFRERGKSKLPVTPVVPMWFDAGGCAATDLRLPPGELVLREEYVVSRGGKFLASAGDAAQYGKRVLLERAGTVLADLARQASGTFPLVNWMPRGGVAVAAGDRFRVTAEFNNPLPATQPGGRRAALLLYFLPGTGPGATPSGTGPGATP